MVYEVVWTENALDSYVANIRYLEQSWTRKEIDVFIDTVQKKLDIISVHPYIGSPVAKRPTTSGIQF